MSEPLPASMRFIEMAGTGEPEVMRVGQGPVPQPGPGEVLIKVAAAGVNRPDVQQRKGLYPPPPDASPILGLEVAGTIAARGSDTAPFAEDDKVCALVNGGGYAEYVKVAVGQCLPIPAGLSMVEAAGLPETFFTVWANVFQRGHLAKGENFLVHGGTSGIGTTAIQLAHAFGARVFTTAGSPEKAAFCKTIGADVAIDYKAEDFVQVVKDATDKRGVNLVLDMVGGDYFERNLHALAMDGRLVHIAFLQGAKLTANMTPIMVKRLTVTGSTLRPRTPADKANIARELYEQVWPLVAAGTVKPIIHKTFPLADAPQAHALMESSTHIGKIILTL